MFCSGNGLDRVGSVGVSLPVGDLHKWLQGIGLRGKLPRVQSLIAAMIATSCYIRLEIPIVVMEQLLLIAEVFWPPKTTTMLYYP